MAGLTDLDEMLASLAVERRDGTFTVIRVEADGLTLGDGIEALVTETEGTTAVVEIDAARRRGWVVEFEAAWLTLTVHSSLEAVGLTAAVSDVLAADGIACNVLAGFHHDHLLVPVDRADDATAAIRRLRDRSR